MPQRDQFKTEDQWLEHLRLWFVGQVMTGMTAMPFTDGAMDEMAAAAFRLADSVMREMSV